jgi:hypothetical protein
LKQDGAFSCENESETVLERMYAAFPHLLQYEARLAEMETELKTGESRIIAEYTDLQDKYVKEGGLEFRGRCASILGRLGFDTAAAECVIKFKERYTDAALVLILPCKNQAEMWGYSDRARYERILGRADAVSYVGEEYRRGCMHERNRAMVHESSACIAYCKRNSGGSAYTVAYAQKMGLSVINLANSL